MNRRTFLTGTVTAAGTFAGCGRSGGAGAPRTNPRADTMRIAIRRAADRGHADHGWLDTYHSFSFADYHDPAHMGFRALRVINQDRVAAGKGFATHPHRDMEIFSYVLAGTIAHRDSMGNGRALSPGEIQLMSAGTGVTHSEFNPSPVEPLHLLQIWIQPDRRGLAPSYTEWKPTPEQAGQRDVVVISPDGRSGSAIIHQDAIVRRLRLAAGDAVDHTVAAGRGMWVQLISGRLAVAGQELEPGDGASTEQAGPLQLRAIEAAEALLFDLGPWPARG